MDTVIGSIVGIVVAAFVIWILHRHHKTPPGGTGPVGPGGPSRPGGRDDQI